MNPAGPDRLRFGSFLLDLRRRGLYRDGVRLHLTPKPFETLAYLVAHRDRTVQKQELLDVIWASAAVTDGVLTQAIREVRRSLSDDADNPSFVLTVPRDGYRFVGTVEPDAADATSPPPAHAHRPGPVRWRRPGRRALLGLSGVAAVVLIALFGPRFGRQPPTAESERLERLSPLTPAEVSAVKPVYSPDGSALAYVSDGDEPGVLDVFVTDATSYRPRRLTRAANASGDLPAFTADGSAVVFARFRTGEDGGRIPDLWRVRATGGEAVRFMPDASGAGFSPDGHDVGYTRLTGHGPALYVGPIDAPARHREIARPGFTPRWSADGRSIAFSTSNPEGGRGDVWIVSRDGASRRRMTHVPAQIYGLSWAGSDRVVFASNQDGTYHLWEARLTEATARPITSGLGDYFSPTVAPDASRIAFTFLRLTSELHVSTLGAAGENRVLARNDYHETPRLSPDGRRAATIVSRADAEPRACVIDLASGHLTLVGTRSARGLCWVDARRLAVLAPAAAGATDVLLADVEAPEVQLLTRVAGDATWVAVRPDLRRLALVTQHGERSRVVLKDLDTGTDSQLAEGRDLRAPRFSPDGGSLAWSASPQGAAAAVNGLWVSSPGAPPRHVLGDGYGPVWATDARALYFSRYADVRAGAGVWRLDLVTGETTQVVRAPRIGDFDVVGSRLLYAVASGRAQVFTAALR